MKNSYTQKLKFGLALTALIFVGLSRLYSQPADAVPIIKYAVNNFATISKACDTCLAYAGKPLMKGRPIPLPAVAAFDALTGLDPKYIPGIIAPNFIGGGSPEIKGLVKNVAGMINKTAQYLRTTEKLYFRTGANGVALTKNGEIITAASTILPGYPFKEESVRRGFFSFKSSPRRIPSFNSTSAEEFIESSKKFVYTDGAEFTFNMEVIHFVINPKNESVVYASLRNPESTSAKVLAKRNPDNGKWEILEFDVPGELDGAVWGSLAMDDDGSLYVADPVRHIIVKIKFDDDGKVASRQIIGGKPDTPGFVNDEDGQDARFNKPSGICLDADGNIYIGDAGNNVVRLIDNDGEVTTYAGNGEKGFEDDEDWQDAKFWGPTALAYNEKTKALYVVDFENKLIREIQEINGKRGVSTLAGNAGSLDPRQPSRLAMTVYYILAQLNMDPDESKLENPTGIVIDPSGYGLYVSDGQYIKYVNTFQALFEVTSSYRSPDSKIPFVGPVLPFGIFMNPNNGSFFGVATTTWEPTTYTIRATNTVDKSFINGVVTFEVVECPDEPVTITESLTISPKQLPYTWNGQTLTGAGTASVTLKTSLGCDSVTVLNLVVRPEFNYNCDPYTLSLGLAINPIIPATSGAKMDSFSVSPSLPAGLTLNAQTGVISGTPTAYTTSQLFAAIGPKTPQQYPAPWALESNYGADLSQVQILDCNQKVYFENNTGFQSLQGSAGPGTGTAGAYTDFSGLGPIKITTNTSYTFRLANTLSGGYVTSLNTSFSQANYMNSYAVYIDYNRDGDFADVGERVYRSAAPQRDAHAEIFNLNIPATATSGVTKMRIYAVEAATWPSTYQFKDADGRLWDANGNLYTTTRTTEQALSFYPFFNDISYRGEQDFSFELNYGEFEDYSIEIQNPVTQSYVVKGSNNIDSAEAIVKISVNDPTRSTTNAIICSTELPYNWNGLRFEQAGTQTATLENRLGADSLATLHLVVKAATMSEIFVAHCGTYNFHGQMIVASNFYYAKIANAAGCDSTIYLTFRQKATTSQNNIDIIPSQLDYVWNNLVIKTGGTYSAMLTNKEGCDSIAILNLRVQYNMYYPTNNLLEINKPMVALRPRIEGNYAPPGGGYSISPALPNGLYLDPFTGAITGTPTQLSRLRTYTVTLQQAGAQPTTLTLSVGTPTASTTTIDNCGPFTWNGVVYDKAGTATFLSKNQYGFDSTATLVLAIRNLSASTTNVYINYSDLPFEWNGDSIRTEGLHTVILRNAAGCDSAATANVVISPKIIYVSPQILQPAGVIVPIAPQSLGGKPTNFTITPALVTGLQFDASTGIISGTPANTLVQPVAHTVSATNGAGSDTAKLVIAVCNPIATSFNMDTCNQYIWIDSTYTSSTIHTRILKNRGGCDSTVTMNLTIRKGSTGATTTIVACSNYAWYGMTYDKTGVYTKVFPNSVGCDSTLTLNLTVNYPSVNNLYVNLNASDLPYKWRNKTFTAPGSDTVLLRNVNSVGCDSTVRMTVSISAMLPDITYAVTDTTLHWGKMIETAIAMSNTGTPIPAMKLGESDTLIKFANAGPGDHIRNTVKGGDGAYYSRVHNNSTVFKLSPSGVWAPFVNAGSAIKGLAIDTSGNLYVAISSYYSPIKKITPDGNIGDLPGSPLFSDPDNVFVDGDNNLFILTSSNYTQLDIVKFNLSTGAQVNMKLDNSPYFQFGPEDMKVDSKGNIYVYRNADNVLVKIRPDGRMSGIGRRGSDNSVFKPGNGPDATLSTIYSMAMDPTNDNLYLMATGQLIRVDTAENVTAITGRTFDTWKDQIFRVDNGKVSVINNTSGRLFTSNVYGVGSLPFMDNYGADELPYNGPKTDFKNLDRRIRLDSSGSIVGTPRGYPSSGGGWNTVTGYTIVGSNHHGVSTAPMAITVKGIIYKREHVVTASFPFVWRGRSFTAPTDTATHFVPNRNWVRESPADDTLYMLHLVYEGTPEPIITSTCVEGGVSLTATGAARSSIKFDGTNFGKISYLQTGGGVLGYFNANSYPKPDNTWGYNFSYAFEVWIKPATVSGTQYILTRDTVKTHGTFFGLSVQDGKFVYEFRKGNLLPFTDHILRSNSNIEANVWTHVAASYYDSTMYIFVNGKLEGKLQTPDGSWFGHYPNSTQTINLSSDLFLAGLGTKNGFRGEMDEFRAWGWPRIADSIQANVNTIVNPKSPGLGLYYRFDEKVGEGAMDISQSNRRVRFIKPATSVGTSGAPINFASYKWMPGGETTKSVIAKPTSNILYTVTVKDYKGTAASTSLLVYPAQGPTITAPAAITKYNNPSSCTVFISDADLGIATASDNCPGVMVERTGVPAGNVFPVGVTTITYTASNAAGRTSVATQTVTIKDNQKPVITSNGNKAVNNDKDVCGATVTVSASATDNCSVGMPIGVRSDGLLLSAMYPLGTTTITWNVADANGNAALPVVQTVTVTDNQIPVITTNGHQVLNNDKDVCGAVVKASATAKDNCTVGVPTGVRSDGLALAAVYPVGTTTITWNVTDAKGNVAMPVTQTVTITDNQKPTVVTKNISVTLMNGSASITAAQIDAGSKDNCGIKSITVSPSTFKCGTYGDNVVTLSVTDINGNIGTKTAIVNVKGAPVPSIVVTRADNTFTGLDGKTIALGYGAQQLTLVASNPSSPVNATTYKWSPAIGLSNSNTAATVFKPTAAGNFVFTVSATNEYGCTGTSTVAIKVVDVRCGNSNDKVLVCHKTGSKSNPTTQVCISKNAVATHLSNGSTLGCGIL